jgi:hypothetical protein
MRKLASIAVAIACAGSLSPAQAPPDLAGTWRLDEAKSKVVATAGIIGLISAGAPKTLHITQPANGTIVVESQINEGHSRIYKPGRESSTPAGQGGAVTMTTKWDGKTLVSEGALKAPNGDTTPVREVVSLSADGKVLTLEVVTTPMGQTEKASSTLVFTRITDVGPCETWPTPCKKFP